MRGRTLAASWILLVGVLAGASACDNQLPTPRTSNGPTPVSIVFVTVTGVVRDEAGAPVAGAIVGFRYFDFYQDEFVWQLTPADGAGRYELVVQLSASPSSMFLRASADENVFEPTFQVVQLTAGARTRDFRLRKIRQSPSDEAAVVSFDAESSLCLDENRPLDTEDRCETVRITATRGGLLTVDVRPAGATGVLPSVALNGQLSGLEGRASAYVQAGQTCSIRIKVPVWFVPGDYVVSASVQ